MVCFLTVRGIWGEGLKEKVLVQDLRLGMYVYELDRPWIDTPFLFQGFHIESRDEIEELKKGNVGVAIVLAAVIIATGIVVAVTVMPTMAK